MRMSRADGTGMIFFWYRDSGSCLWQRIDKGATTGWNSQWSMDNFSPSGKRGLEHSSWMFFIIIAFFIRHETAACDALLVELPSRYHGGVFQSKGVFQVDNYSEFHLNSKSYCLMISIHATVKRQIKMYVLKKERTNSFSFKPNKNKTISFVAAFVYSLGCTQPTLQYLSSNNNVIICLPRQGVRPESRLLHDGILITLYDFLARSSDESTSLFS